MNPLASDIISHCGSYTEKSRSGRGVHILLKGSLPFKGRNNRAGVEIYRSGRYFIMTGKVIIYSEIIEIKKRLIISFPSIFLMFRKKVPVPPLHNAFIPQSTESQSREKSL